MLRIAPDYYKEFACIKGNCRHSCCIGWEIDIDDETLAYYRSLGGVIGDRLKRNIATEGDCTHFKLGENERCPFLNEEGLCDLIINLGEDCICQICDDHPRFRNFYSGREEIGLGLCCEAAASLILGRNKPMELEIMDDDGDGEGLFEDEEELLSLRNVLISILQNRGVSVSERISKMLSYLQIDLPEFDVPSWLDFLLSLERLDENWGLQLNKLESLENADISDPETEIPFEQLIVYLIYRHINCDDDDLAGRIAFCVFVFELIKAMLGSGSKEDLFELARMYSSEIEYSDENMSAIIDELHRRLQI